VQAPAPGAPVHADPVIESDRGVVLVAGEGPAPDRCPVAGDGHRDDDLGQVGAEVLGVAEGPLGLLQWAADPVVVDGVGQVGQLVGALDLPARARRIDKDNVKVQVQQVRDRGEHLGGDLVQRRETEVHPPVGRIVAEPFAGLDGDSLCDPAGRGQLAARLQGTLGDQGEDGPLDRVAVQTATLRDPPDRRPDPQTFPEPVQHPGPTHTARVNDLHLDSPGRGHGLLRGQEPGDRGHQPGQGVSIHVLRPTKAVDHLRHRATGLRVPFVVCELQVGHHRTVPVGPPRLPQVHAYTKSCDCAPCPAKRH
jgi:hypothetical protein